MFYEFKNENFHFKICCWKHSFSGFTLRNNQQYFNICSGFAHRLGQSWHIWKIALSDPEIILLRIDLSRIPRTGWK